MKKMEGRTEITLRLAESLVARVDTICRRHGMSRTEWLRRCVAMLSVPDWLLDEIREAIAETWEVYDGKGKTSEITIEQYLAGASLEPENDVVPIPDSWKDLQCDLLCQKAAADLKELRVTDLYALWDSEPGDNRRERIILRYVADAMAAADAFQRDARAGAK